MKYRNRKTGDVLDVPCVVSGPDWEAVQDQPEKAEKTAEKKPKKTPKKKGD